MRCVSGPPGYDDLANDAAFSPVHRSVCQTPDWGNERAHPVGSAHYIGGIHEIHSLYYTSGRVERGSERGCELVDGRRPFDIQLASARNLTGSRHLVSYLSGAERRD